MTDTAPNRRRFRWSLRTIFVVVTALGCWLGYEVNWIRERHVVVADFVMYRAYRVASNSPSAPSFLWLFGEKGYTAVVVYA